MALEDVHQTEIVWPWKTDFKKTSLCRHGYPDADHEPESNGQFDRCGDLGYSIRGEPRLGLGSGYLLLEFN